MNRLKKLLSLKVLIIFIFTAFLTYVDTQTDLKLGLDLKGGTQLDYFVDMGSVPDEDQAQIIEGVQEVIRKRVDSLGVSEPNIYLSKVGQENHVIVELAGISDIEEAKDTVGKTIQLEFREENNEPSNDQVEWATTAANDFYAQVRAGQDFVTFAQETAENDTEHISFTEQEAKDITTLSEGIQEAIKGYGVGSIIAPFESSLGYTVSPGSSQLQEMKGYVVLQITDKKTDQVETVVDEEVSARHILIAYEGAERSEATRTKEEAESLANELLDRIKGGESLSDLAGEFSDDAGSGANGGDLGSFKRGVMTQNFEDTAFGLGIDELSEIVETEFGYHIIQAYDRIEGATTTENVDLVAYNQIAFSTTPSPWKEEPAITGEHFKRADVVLSQTYQPVVSITFTSEGAKLFEDLTSKNINKSIAIFVGGELISAPNVNQTISGGQGQITGNFSLEEAQELARDLNTGAIPAPIELVGQYTISATLGAEALDTSIYAGIIGLAILGLFMLLYYRLPGLIANIALVIYSVILIFFIKVALPTSVALILGIALFVYLTHLILTNKDSAGEKAISFLLACVILFFMTFVLSSQITLTLAGVAGVILSIGMAVDANVLIFERMKEELAAGKNLHNSIDDGFKRAWDSIRDSNFSSLITCAILFYFGSSIIRGFALNLALGILVSMFSAITLTFTLLHFASESKLKNNLSIFGKPRHERPHFGFIKNSKIWAAISGTLLTIAIVATALFGLRLGLDFTGGTLMEFGFPQEEAIEETTEIVEAVEGSTVEPEVTEDAPVEGVITSDDIMASLLEVEQLLTTEESEADFGTPSIVETDQGTFIIRMKHLDDTEYDAIKAELSANFEGIEEIRFTTVGPTIGKTLKQKALVALAITLVMIVLYIAFAFRKIPKEVSPWRFGFCAIAALLHDVILIVGVFVLLGRYMGVEIDALFITALLTIMGFSVHDTIVVFDRVRENLKFRGSEDNLEASANKALNQTLARSMNTSFSTMITIVALLIFGADSIRWFVFALALGILVGTYSSIFVASPLLVWWNNMAQKKQ